MRATVCWWPGPCWLRAAIARPPRCWRGWGGGDLGEDHPATSPAARTRAARAGSDAAAYAAGVAAGAARWQQTVDPAGLDRRRAGHHHLGWGGDAGIAGGLARRVRAG